MSQTGGAYPQWDAGWSQIDRTRTASTQRLRGFDCTKVKVAARTELSRACSTSTASSTAARGTVWMALPTTCSFILSVTPIEPAADEEEAWEAFLTAVNDGGWERVQTGLVDARERGAAWESVLDTIGRVDGVVEKERVHLAEAIGSVRAEHLVSQLVRRVLLAKAECLERLGRWEQCVDCYSKVDNDGEDAELYFKRGCCYYYAGNGGTAGAYPLLLCLRFACRLCR